MTRDDRHRDPNPTSFAGVRDCGVCEETTRHAVEERQFAGVASLLFTCEQCSTMTSEPQRQARVLHLNADQGVQTSADISFHRSA